MNGEADEKLLERIENELRAMSAKVTVQNGLLLVSQTVQDSGVEKEVTAEFTAHHKSTAIKAHMQRGRDESSELPFEVQGEWFNCKMSVLAKNSAVQQYSSVLDLAQTHDAVKKQLSAAVDGFLSAADLSKPFGIRLIFDDTTVNESLVTEQLSQDNKVNETLVTEQLCQDSKVNKTLVTERQDQMTDCTQLRFTASDEETTMTTFGSSPTATLRPSSHSVDPSFTSSDDYYSANETERRTTSVKGLVSPSTDTYSCMETMHRSTFACICPKCRHVCNDYCYQSPNCSPAISPVIEVVDDSEIESDSSQKLGAQASSVERKAVAEKSFKPSRKQKPVDSSQKQSSIKKKSADMQAASVEPVVNQKPTAVDQTVLKQTARVVALSQAPVQRVRHLTSSDRQRSVIVEWSNNDSQLSEHVASAVVCVTQSSAYSVADKKTSAYCLDRVGVNSKECLSPASYVFCSSDKSPVVGLTSSAKKDDLELTVVFVNDHTKCTQTTSAHSCAEFLKPNVDGDVWVMDGMQSRNVLIQVGQAHTARDHLG